MITLDEIAILYGTDKKSSKHNYTSVYDSLFTPFRQDTFNFLEIGLYYGKSLRMWRDYFPNATIYSVDIRNFHVRKYKNEERVVVQQLDQGDEVQLREYAKQGPWRVIIDDGSHVSAHQNLTFDILWNAVEPGGYYIVEDTHTSYWKHPRFVWTQEGEDTFIQRMLKVTDLFCSATYWKGASNNYHQRRKMEDLNKYQLEIEYIQFCMGLVIMKKRL
jgi:hypothetical protein